MSDFFLKIINDKPASTDTQTTQKQDNLPTSTKAEPWIIGIIDDEPGMHEVTKLALSRVEILGRPLAFVSAYDATEGYNIIGITLTWH